MQTEPLLADRKFDLPNAIYLFCCSCRWTNSFEKLDLCTQREANKIEKPSSLVYSGSNESDAVLTLFHGTTHETSFNKYTPREAFPLWSSVTWWVLMSACEGWKFIRQQFYRIQWIWCFDSLHVLICWTERFLINLVWSRIIFNIIHIFHLWIIIIIANWVRKDIVFQVWYKMIIINHLFRLLMKLLINFML